MNIRVHEDTTQVQPHWTSLSGSLNSTEALFTHTCIKKPKR